MAREAKAEEQNIKHALKDVKKAEKAVKKSVKVRALLLCPGPRCVRRLVPILIASLGLGSQAVEKAEKKKQKVLKTEHSTVKALNKAKHKHADVLEGEAQAEAAAAVRFVCLLRANWASGLTARRVSRHAGTAREGGRGGPRRAADARRAREHADDPGGQCRE